jgi:hypothetical protein
MRQERSLLDITWLLASLPTADNPVYDIYLAELTSMPRYAADASS